MFPQPDVDVPVEQARLAHALNAYLAHERHDLSRRAAAASALCELVDLHPLIDLSAPPPDAPRPSWPDVRASVAPAVEAASTLRELSALARAADALGAIGDESP